MQTVEQNGLTYKVGKFGFAYYLNDLGEWVKSDKTGAYIAGCIEGRKSVDTTTVIKCKD